MMISAVNLSAIVALFDAAKSPAKLVVQRDGCGFACSLKALSFCERFFSACASPEKQDRDTCCAFRELIGESRIQRLFQRAELKHLAHALNDNTLVLDKDLLRVVFLELGDIHIEDLQAARPGVNLSELSVAELDRLYRELIPFKKIDDLFFRQIPQNSYYTRPFSGGKGVEGLAERVKLRLDSWRYYRTHTDESSEKKRVHEVELINSRLGDRHPPVGTVVRGADRYLVYDAVFEGSGGYATALRDIKGGETLIACRGTSGSLSVTGFFASHFNNFLLEPALLACQALFPQIQRYLQEKRVTHVTLSGKSQGGGLAQMLAPLVERFSPAQVDGVTLYASIGVSERVRQTFERVFRGRAEPVEVEAFFNEGEFWKGEIDFVPWIGEGYVGVGGKVRAYALVPEGSENRAVREGLSWWQLLIGFFPSFTGAHSRENSLGAYRIERIENIEVHFSGRPLLETLRKVIAWIVNIITLGYFNSVSYDDYFAAQYSTDSRRAVPRRAVADHHRAQPAVRRSH